LFFLFAATTFCEGVAPEQEVSMLRLTLFELGRQEKKNQKIRYEPFSFLINITYVSFQAKREKEKSLQIHQQ